MTDFRPPLDPAFAIFGVDVVIPFAPGVGTLVTVRAVPLPAGPREDGVEALRDEVRQVLAFRRAELTAARIDRLPRGTLIEAQGYTWKVDSVAILDQDDLRVMVVR